MTPMIGMPQGAEWLVILAIVIIVFGAAKLPELARGTGQALRIFKSETKGLRDDDKDDDAKDAQATVTPDPTPTELPPARTTEAAPEGSTSPSADKHHG
ncbi:Sec-independent protein translocase protein TatA [Nocardioides sp. OK12]|uniref:Sec-independent protein translocase protein TatA n=1 Tax=Nocardioides marinisabuli TaxID=419476 RepID=A0A7Y9F444_9ACTN|nr:MULTISPECIES: Sec-independent protein translocase subunit TatA [Nocardioides]NYD59041.1 sec-independent protein translocase protein TatA [Nocardioides marinisabuli]GHJ60156.1 Sec-independent protein translocase protein TatA [Nocardioides sp. OK12]